MVSVESSQTVNIQQSSAQCRVRRPFQRTSSLRPSDYYPGTVCVFITSPVTISYMYDRASSTWLGSAATMRQRIGHMICFGACTHVVMNYFSKYKQNDA